MGTSAEDALAALARDLLEEISAGRAVELVQAWRDDPEADLLELARFNVRPFQRTTTVHGRRVVENVGAHTAERGGVPGVSGAGGMQSPKTIAKESANITGAGLEHPGGWIPNADWVKGQAEWAAKGEAIWKANQWKAHQKLFSGIRDTRQHISNGPKQPKKGEVSVHNAFVGSDVDKHLDEAQKHLNAAREAGNDSPGESVGRVYQHLLGAHRDITENVLPKSRAKEQRAHAEEALKQVRGHLDSLDQSMGMKKGSTSKPLEAEHTEALKTSKRFEQLHQVGDAVAQTSLQLDRDPTPTRVSLWRFDPKNDAQRHMMSAIHLLRDPTAGPGSVADAYHQLSEAHRIGVEFALPHATKPEHKEAVRKGLDAIQAHMQELDRIAGLDPKRTEQLLGSPQEHDERARVSLQRQEDEKNSAPNWLAPGRNVTDPRFARRGDEGATTGTVTRVYKGKYGARVELKWNDGQTGSYSLDAAKELLQPAPGSQPAPEGSFMPAAEEVQTGMEADLKKAQAEALVGKQVRIDPKGADPGPRIEYIAKAEGGIGTVVRYPEQIWDVGAEEMEPNPGNYVEVRWGDKDFPMAVPADALMEHVPEPPKGAEAVHPQLGGHLVRMPGDTISQRNYAHVPRPMQMPEGAPPSAQEAELRDALAESQKRITGYAQRDDQRRQDQLQRNLAETRAKEMEARGIAAPGTYQPLSDAEFSHHVAQLEDAVQEALRNGQATDQQFALDEHGTVWDPDRAAQHRDIINDFMNKQVDVPSQRQAVMLGGPPGAGKSTFLDQHEGIRPGDYAILNTDHFKEELARRGMVPEVPGLSPMEASALVHEESAYLHDLAAAELEKRGKNVVFDGTMRDHAVTQDRVQALRRRGYNVGAMFIDVPVERSLQGVESRYRRGLEEYRAGRNPLGGRHVPRSVVLSGESAPGRTKARDTFDALKSDFTWWELHDGVTGEKLDEATAQQQSGGSIPSVEELRRQMSGGTFPAPPAAQPSSDEELRRVLGGPGALEADEQEAVARSRRVGLEDEPRPLSRLALDQYQFGGIDINKALREGRPVSALRAGNLKEEAVKVLTHMVHTAPPLAEDKVVWRGTPGVKPRKPGETWTNPAFTSLSTDRGLAGKFLDQPLRPGPGQMLRITLPAGSRVLDTSQVPGGQDDEKAQASKGILGEFLLAPGSRFRAVGENPDGSLNVIYTGATEAEAQAREHGTNT